MVQIVGATVKDQLQPLNDAIIEVKAFVSARPISHLLEGQLRRRSDWKCLQESQTLLKIHDGGLRNGCPLRPLSALTIQMPIRCLLNRIRVFCLGLKDKP